MEKRSVKVTLGFATQGWLMFAAVVLLAFGGLGSIVLLNKENQLGYIVLLLSFISAMSLFGVASIIELLRNVLIELKNKNEVMK